MLLSANAVTISIYNPFHLQPIYLDARFNFQHSQSNDNGTTTRYGAQPATAGF
jgi:hypothetical protein